MPHFIHVLIGLWWWGAVGCHGPHFTGRETEALRGAVPSQHPATQSPSGSRTCSAKAAVFFYLIIDIGTSLKKGFSVWKFETTIPGPFRVWCADPGLGASQRCVSRALPRPSQTSKTPWCSSQSNPAWQGSEWPGPSSLALLQPHGPAAFTPTPRPALPCPLHCAGPCLSAPSQAVYGFNV